MNSFLEHVASELLSRFGTDLSRVAVVFPNKRASLFLNDYLAHQAGRPIWSPSYITISELFRHHSALQVADPILLVCELYKCFTQCTGIDETLDHFYGWGQLLLSDFDDLDKNMAPADLVFANLRDIHELDDVSYLTPEQRDMLRRFFSNFTDDHNTELKQRFLKLWSRIGQIYQTFNNQLAEQGLAYEGALYRQVASDEDIPWEYDHYVFVGFNLLLKVEQTIIDRLQHDGKAIIFQDKTEKPPRELTYITAPTENIQARYVSQWLTAERIADGRRTAIVLCDESLLQTVIHCLPDSVDKVNVTTGYPLLQTSIATLVTQLLNLHINGYSTRNNNFRRHWLQLVSRHPFAHLMPENYLENHLTDTPSMLRWLTDIVSHIATATTFEALDAESLFRMYTLLNRLNDLSESGVLTIDVITLQRLIQQLISSTSIPFHGEPAEGVQIMGVLETRNLDFDHVLFLSCNEGNMPKGVNDTSFIPYAIRKAYGLTTVDHKVAIYQHYFHRLLQRATDVTIVYNNATTDGHTGEMSRFMLQLMAEGRQTISFRHLQAGQQPLIRSPKPIAKTLEVCSILQHRFSKEQHGISPTAVSSWLRCQIRFFYRYVSSLAEPDDNTEDLIDNRLFGNIFHKAAQTLYLPFVKPRPTLVTRSHIDALINDKSAVSRAVDQAIKSELFHVEDPVFQMPALDGLQLINREVIIKYIHLLLEQDRRLTPFTILGLEHYVAMPWEGTILGGIIDRLDLISDPATGQQRIRVVDYKTGSRQPKVLPDIEAIFDPQNIPSHSDYYLQAFLYSYIVKEYSLPKLQRSPNTSASQLSASLPVSPALLFIQHASADDYDPTLSIAQDKVNDISPYAEQFMQLLENTIKDIFNPEIPFSPTEDQKRCQNCPYAMLCGR